MLKHTLCFLLPTILLLSFPRVMAKLSDIKCVGMEGFQSVWKITKSNDIIHLDGKIYVKVVPNNTSLVALVCEANADAPQPTPNNYSLTSCKGWAKLVQLRNEKQAAELIAETHANNCNLFDEDCSNQKKRTTDSK